MVLASVPPREGYVNSSEDFEKWIRMATDNKINTSNSWDLALIDYFYDLSLLRDGEGINFQKASATLDGCVKIYSSRVDSAVTETGRLISGLATRRDGNDAEEIAEDETEELDPMDPDAPQKQKKTRSATKKDTLLEWKQLKVKQVDMELYVDPLFKKALADFDEGGSKSLLLNMLNVDHVGRILFDTTDSAEHSLRPIGDEALEMFEQSFAEMDIDKPEEDMGSQTDATLRGPIMELGKRFLSTMLSPNEMLCPSLAELRSVVEQKSASADLLKNLEQMVIPETYDYTLNGNYETTYQGFEVSVTGANNDFYDDGGADELYDGAVDENNSKYPGNKTSIFFDDNEDEADDYGVTMRMLFGEKTYDNANAEEMPNLNDPTIIPDEDLLAYFDENQRRNWAGPDHWKVTRLKNRVNKTIQNLKTAHDGEQNAVSTTRKRKEPLIIDFLSDDNFPDPNTIFEEPTVSIDLPKNQWKAKDKHALPDDRHFTTRNFITLFTKDKLINSRFSKIKNVEGAINETVYADTILPEQPEHHINQADFYNDYGADDNGGADFYDDGDSGGASQPISSQLLSKSLGSQLPLNYSRVSKKVDIALLKENLWDTLKQERSSQRALASPIQPATAQAEVLKFTEIVGGLGQKYDPKTKKDLSTSVCFICLLHLANENGFTIQNNSDNSDLIIKNFAD
ncbi:CYFA0S10e02850g1_1 [Cyberlindnera fabianii]|uniref:Condensin complex subunit 2 n=1 Tax=Cyberlindnera fabianii TaxID=36022 RepID=A0A061AYT6_CYBFA|nr:CYFA0S10e02850g1_1 [Cyberlindnera fabianii]